MRASRPINSRQAVASMRGLYDQNAPRRLPNQWRDCLPAPDAYYRANIGKLGKANGGGWAQGTCPFHDDKNASLSVKIAERGNWKCFAGCGSGDMLSFHMRRTCLPFADAVRDLLGVRA